MMKISWVEQASNDEVLARKEKTLWKYITKRRDTLIGHIVRHDGIMSTILEGEIEGKNAQGQQRLQHTPQIMEDMNCQTYQEFKRLAQNRHTLLAFQRDVFNKFLKPENQQQTGRKGWMNDQILSTMEKRRKVKNKDPVMIFTETFGRNTERLRKPGSANMKLVMTYSIYVKKVKETTGSIRKNTSGNISDEEGDIVF
ncbi:hypothetical protein ILUMI_02758 [Ignelater luminosus]|uniref:Uncharacterized protein n=1 Tax=Ignelater luminosus TaxID=2038154 RepID=A0A8K0GIZ7_IGNLU|nr:hypothetical protein ILUMI_02758 [Ignelater luminosus]